MKYEQAELLGIKEESKDIHILTFMAPGVAAGAEPGQFVNVYPDEPGAFFLPRPLSIMDTREDGTIEILFKVVGKGTAIMAGWEKGEKVRLNGPLGRRLETAKGIERLILVAGGLGIAPLYFLLKKSRSENTNLPKTLAFIYGTRSAGELVILDRLRELEPGLLINTEDGSAGDKGLVTDTLSSLLDEMPPAERISTAIAACGPRGMLGALRKMMADYGVKGYFSMEERMGCGMGVCLGCAVPVKMEGNESETVYERVCREGPWFDAGRLADEAFITDASVFRTAKDTIQPDEVDLTTILNKKLILQNPVVMASGTFGYGLDYRALWHPSLVGAVVTKTVTMKPKKGNPPPRIAEVAGGMLNSIGLQNDGIESFLKDTIPRLDKIGTKVIISIAGDTVNEYSELAAIIDEAAGSGAVIHGIELNVSCPNVEKGGMLFGVSPRITGEIVAKVHKITNLPVIVKLTPVASDIAEVAVAAETNGASVVSLINTLPGMILDLDRGRPLLGNVFGGLSGPAIKPFALALTARVTKAVKIPVIAGGGIATGRDALEFIGIGAAAVQVGSALFAQPDAPVKMLYSIRNFLADKGIKDISRFRGTLLESI